MNIKSLKIDKLQIYKGLFNYFGQLSSEPKLFNVKTENILTF